MHVPILQILGSRCLIILGAEACQTLIADIGNHWIKRYNHDKNSEVKFLSIQQKWVLDVLLNDIVRWALEKGV
jgi:hypothetical protein